MDGSPGMLKLELVKSEADECLLLEEIIHPSLGPALPRGVEVIEGVSGSTTLLRKPVGLRNVSIVLESRGRVVSTVPEAIQLRPLQLLLADPVVGEGEQLHFLELWACGDFAWQFGVDSWGRGGVLANMESGCFGVEVLESHPVPRRGPLLLLEHLVLEDSMDMSRAAALCGDYLTAAGSLLWDGAGGMGISSWKVGR